MLVMSDAKCDFLEEVAKLINEQDGKLDLNDIVFLLDYMAGHTQSMIDKTIKENGDDVEMELYRVDMSKTN